MYITTMFIVLALLVLLIIFLPDILPCCSLCGRHKLRLFFAVHKNTGIRLGYSAYKSVCSKCCRKYGIKSLSDLKRYESARRKSEINILGKI